LQCGFRAGQASADDFDLLHAYRIGEGLLFGECGEVGEGLAGEAHGGPLG
jgi:hypothetical protein